MMMSLEVDGKDELNPSVRESAAPDQQRNIIPLLTLFKVGKEVYLTTGHASASSALSDRGYSNNCSSLPS